MFGYNHEQNPVASPKWSAAMLQMIFNIAGSKDFDTGGHCAFKRIGNAKSLRGRAHFSRAALCSVGTLVLPALLISRQARLVYVKVRF